MKTHHVPLLHGEASRKKYYSNDYRVVRVGNCLEFFDHLKVTRMDKDMVLSRFLGPGSDFPGSTSESSSEETAHMVASLARQGWSSGRNSKVRYVTGVDLKKLGVNAFAKELGNHGSDYEPSPIGDDNISWMSQLESGDRVLKTLDRVYVNFSGELIAVINERPLTGEDILEAWARSTVEHDIRR